MRKPLLFLTGASLAVIILFAWVYVHDGCTTMEPFRAPCGTYGSPCN